MTTDRHLQFIASKIIDLDVALFHSHAKTLLKFPAHIISTLKVDEDGNIFMFVPRPKQLISQFEKEFPVSLNYFKKGKCHFLNVYGKARIVNDPEELNSYNLTYNEINRASTSDLLIKVKILKADYYDKERIYRNSWVDKAKTFVYSLLAFPDADNKSFEFGTQPGMRGFGF